MEGMFFVELVNGQLVSQGQIEKDAGRGMWLIHFFAPDGKGMRRVIPSEKCQAMLLFPNGGAMQEWLAANAGPGEEPAEEPAEEPGSEEPSDE